MRIASPANLQAKRTGSTVVVTWTRDPNADYDIISRDGTRLATVGTPTYTDQRVTNVPHVYSVQSHSNASPSATVSLAIGAPIPPTPTGLTVEVTP